jgi:hypothetical protein
LPIMNPYTSMWTEMEADLNALGERIINHFFSMELTACMRNQRWQVNTNNRCITLVLYVRFITLFFRTRASLLSGIN